MDDPNAYILKQYLDKIDKKLEDYTLKEVKQLCGQQLDCLDCPFFTDDKCKVGKRLPEYWEL